MVQFARRYYQQLSDRRGEAVADDEIHILNEREMADLRRIEWIALAKAAGIGVAAALLCSLAIPLTESILGPWPTNSPFVESIWHWVVVGAMYGIATVLELVLLYWLSLNAIHHLSHVAGLNLFDEPADRSLVLNGLLHAASQLPYRDDNFPWIRNPGSEINRTWILLASLVYRLKVTLTFYVVRAIVQRFVGRVAVRWTLDLVAIPVYAFWDALVTHWVVRHGRICCMGPSAAVSLIDELLENSPDVSEAGKQVAVRAAASAVARNSQLHPNVAALIGVVIDRLGQPEFENIDDSSALLDTLRSANQPDQEFLLRILAIALILDGRISYWEKRLYREAAMACGREPNDQTIREALAKFRSGRPLSATDLL